MSHNEVNGGLTGIAMYAGTTASYNYVHGSKTYGVSGFQGSNTLPTITVTDNEIASNGGTPDSGGSSGGTKFSHTTTTMSHNYVHDNTGPVNSTAALWCDYDNLCTFDSNLVTHNGGTGILQEMDFLTGNTGTISNNTVQDDCQLFLGQSILYCSDIQVRDSNNVAAYNNTVTETTNVNPMAIVLDSRVSSITGNYVHDNLVTFGSGGHVGFGGTTDRVTNHFDHDTYHVSLASPFTVDGSTAIAWPVWQSAGQDQTATLISG